MQGASAAHAASEAPAKGGAACLGKVDPSLHRTASGAADVIVVGRSSSAVAAAVARAGGHVVSAQPMVSGVRATVPAGRIGHLACAASIVSISPNRAVRFASNDWVSAGETASVFASTTGAPRMWQDGTTGRVGVAVIDTGISPMDDLAGRIVYGPDLSGEGTIIDSYGHGTVMAGIIGGDGTDSADVPGGPHTGMAPDATLISVKVAGRNGATDVSTILEAMHWVLAYQKQFNIRVLNLSWGTTSTQSPVLDPLDHAVERLWQRGIVVVVAAGNNGPGPRTILKPADDPVVLTVGAYDDAGTTSGADDQVPEWSSVGPTAAGFAKPDLVAPGRTLIAQRSYGSQVEAEHPDALVAPSYIKGSGTSEAAAVTSGAVALLLDKRPDLSPDQVKNILMDTADPIPGAPASEQGRGRLDLNGVADAAAGLRYQQLRIATGLGSLEASRGGRHVQVDCGEDGTPDVIVGEITADCQPWRPFAWVGSSWTGSSWTGSSWTGSSWTGSSWTGSSWTGSSWTGSSWTGSSWTGSSWTGSSWTGSSWTQSEWASEQYPTEFQTIWWGDEPAPDQDVPGETSG
jgi:serine protease AprX